MEPMMMRRAGHTHQCSGGVPDQVAQCKQASLRQRSWKPVELFVTPSAGHRGKIRQTRMDWCGRLKVKAHLHTGHQVQLNAIPIRVEVAVAAQTMTPNSFNV